MLSWSRCRAAVLLTALSALLVWSGCRREPGPAEPEPAVRENPFESMWRPETLLAVDRVTELGADRFDALQAERRETEFQLNREESLRGFGLLDEAVALLREFVDRVEFPSNRIRALRRLAEIYVRKGYSDEAVETFALILEYELDEFQRAEAMLSMGDTYFNAGDFDSARLACEAVFRGAERFHNRYRALQCLRRVVMVRGEPGLLAPLAREFIADAEAAEESDPAVVAAVRIWLAEALLAHGQLEQARLALVETPVDHLERDARRHLRRLGLEAAFLLGDFPAAAEMLEQILAQGEYIYQLSFSPRGYAAFDYAPSTALALAERGSPDQALALLDAAVKHERDSVLKELYAATAALIRLWYLDRAEALALIEALESQMGPLMYQRLLFEAGAALEADDPARARALYEKAADLDGGFRPLAVSAAQRAESLP